MNKETVRNLRVSNALRAEYMVAVRALSSSAFDLRTTDMTVPADLHRNRLLSRVSRSSSNLVFRFLDPLGWESWAVLATCVLTVAADSVLAKSKLASVAGAMHSHADLFLNSCRISFHW